MRIIANSGALHRQLRHHLGHKRVSLSIENHWCTLLSPAGSTGIAVESRHDLVATVDTQRLLDALLSIEDQPITLDLHAWPEANNILYAVRVLRHVDKVNAYEPLSFPL